MEEYSCPTIPLDEAGNSLDIASSLYTWGGDLVAKHGDSHMSLVDEPTAREIINQQCVELPARPASVDEVFAYSSAFIGKREFSGLVEAIKDHRLATGHPVMNVVKGRLSVRNNGVLLTTDHQNIMDLAIAKNAYYCAIGDSQLASQSGIIVNEATTLIEYDGQRMTDILRMTGNVYLNRPRSKSAAKYGITPEISDAFNMKMLRAILQDVHDLDREGKSMMMAAAVTGSTVVPTERGLEIPEVQDATINLVCKYFRFIVPMSFYLPNREAGLPWYNLRPIDVAMRDTHIHETVQDMGGALSEMSGLPVYYMGQPAKLGRTVVSSTIRR